MPRIVFPAFLVAVLLFAVPGAAHAQMCPPPSSAGRIELTGAGTMATRPFDLAGGAYTVQWQAANQSFDGAALMLLLKSADGSSGLGQMIAASQLPQATAVGETNVYAIKPGTYYLDVTAPGAWAVAVTPH